MLRPYIIKYRKAYLGLFFFLSLDIFLTLAFAWFLGQITDAAIQTDFQSLNWLVPLGIVLLLLSLTSSYAGIYLRAITENAVKKDLRVDLFNHILRLPTKTANTLRSGELVTHFTNDINSILGLIGSSLIQFIRLPLIFIAVFIYMSYINLTLTLLCLTIIPFALLSGGVFGLLLRKNSDLFSI